MDGPRDAGSVAVSARSGLGSTASQKKCGLLGATQHQVEVLDGDAGGTFDDVVEAGEDDDLASEDAQGDVAIVGVRWSPLSPASDRRHG